MTVTIESEPTGNKLSPRRDFSSSQASRYDNAAIRMPCVSKPALTSERLNTSSTPRTPLGTWPSSLRSSCSIPLLLILSASELCVCGDACPILLLLGDGYLPGRQMGLCARKR
jgi:hypothetical protein